MRNPRIFNEIIILFFPFLLQGCFNPERNKQINWYENTENAYVLVQKTVDNNAPYLFKEQLIAILGEPDFEITALELYNALPKHLSYSEKVMEDVWKAYCGSPLNRSGLNYVYQKNRWMENEEFKKCKLLIYDESKHFKKPLNWGFGCANSGFTCHIFYLDDNTIAGATYVTFWKPL